MNVACNFSLGLNIDWLEQWCSTTKREMIVKRIIFTTKFSIPGLTRTEIVGNSILMLLAGYETTGNSMIFFAYNLATHPEIQEKLRQEVDETFENYVREWVF